MAKIFISYAREDYQIARKLYDFLVSQGQEPWLDRENLIPGQKWENAIQSAIRKSHFFIAILSTNSIEKRGYIQKELRVGLEILDQVPDSQIFLIPVRIDECQPKQDRLRELQWVDFFPDWQEGLRQLMKVFEFIPSEILASNLSGTRWLITKSTSPKPWSIFLQEDGTIKSYKFVFPKINGTWKQSGNIIYIAFNQNYAQYKGTVNGDEMTGEARNIKGKEWKWKAARIEAEAD